MHVYVPSLWVWNICGIIFGLALYKDANIGTFVEIQRLRWMGRLQRTGQETARKYTKPTYKENDATGEPRLEGKVM